MARSVSPGAVESRAAGRRGIISRRRLAIRTSEQRAASRRTAFRASMNAQEIIDSLERDIERVRSMDPALLASMVMRLDALRKIVAASEA